MDRKAFTIVLPSNSNPDMFPNNAPSKFSVEFENPIHLNGKYEVALIEMTYKNDIVALRNDGFKIFTNVSKDLLFEFMKNKSKTTWEFNSFALSPIEMTDGAYNPDHIWDIFPKQLNIFATISILEQSNNKINISLMKDDVLLVISKSLARMLNFPRTSFSKFSKLSWGMQPKEKVTDWNAKLIPLYALEYTQVILKKKGENITNAEFIKRWNAKFPLDKVVLETRMDNSQAWKIRKRSSLTDTNYSIIQIEDDLIKDLFGEKYPFLVNFHDELDVIASIKRSKSAIDHIWAVRVYSNKIKSDKASIEVSKVNDVLINLDKIESVKSLLDLLNVRSKELGYLFRYDSISKRVSLTIPKSHHIVLDEVLQSMLGFQANKELKEGVTIASHKPILKRNVNNIFVYTNIVNFIHVGNTEAPLMRQFPISSQHNVLINREFINKIFIPVNRTTLDRIDVSIHDEAGALIPFEDGITTITLEFRPLIM